MLLKSQDECDGNIPNTSAQNNKRPFKIIHVAI